MAIDKISPALKAELKYWSSEPKRTALLEKAIVGWSPRVGFQDNLSGIIYKTVQAVKAVFGQSDWQKVFKIAKGWEFSANGIDYKSEAKEISKLKLLLKYNKQNKSACEIYGKQISQIKSDNKAKRQQSVNSIKENFIDLLKANSKFVAEKQRLPLYNYRNNPLYTAVKKSLET